MGEKTFMDRITAAEAAVTAAQADATAALADITAIEAEQAARLFKQARVTTTTNIANLTTGLAAEATLDGVELAVGDRVLVKDQTNAWLNGIYVVPASGAPARAADADAEAKILSALVLVQRGTAGAGTLHQCTAYDTTATTGAVTFAAWPGESE